jgi:Protein of unknown function (DUF1557).
LNGYWVEAKDLRVGDVFLGVNGDPSTLTNIVRVEQDGGIAVFNFTVEGNHNYFILAKEYENGQTCVLVHNGDCPGANGGGGPQHGNSDHDEKIDGWIDGMKQEHGEKLLDIRKNQVQVNVNMEVVGANRPDAQVIVEYDDGTQQRFYYEVDRSQTNSDRHRITIEGHDPAGILITEILKKQ